MGSKLKGASLVPSEDKHVKMVATPDQVTLMIVPPEDWEPAKRACFGLVEKSLLMSPQFNHFSVLPEGCLFLQAVRG